ncbi:ethanolamine ammonia-lyase subunit EutC [Actinotalea sp.]|uniref:ethanolamine ammonia-lyase subunit EutC n=1 Tax=Actinotalea sp. TaxID=1872145 RepID=UPI003562A739
MTVTAAEVREVVSQVLSELRREHAAPTQASPPASPAAPAAPPPVSASPSAPPSAPPSSAPSPAVAATPVPSARPARTAAGDIDVPDPTAPAERHRIGVVDPANPAGLANLASTTAARLAVGRAGPRPRTSTALLFSADHAVTQDAIFGDVPQAMLDELGMFTVQTRVTDQDEFLLRPDLGRSLSDEARTTIAERCVAKPQVQIVVGDGLSAAAVTNNVPQIYPVIVQGLTAAGVSIGTPFFVRYCRVGVMNDINDLVHADVVLLLIGERPGLGVADALSVYSGYQPTAGKTDAHRDVICMITPNGGTNPLEAGAFAVEHVKTVLQHHASGVELRLMQSGSR